MTLKSESAIEKIHEFQRFGSILGLERMTELLSLLGDPQDDLRVIHVAGTNGKGSVCRYIYSVLKEAGYKTGIYISPFIESFNERIEIDGRYISDEDLAEYTDKVLEAVKTMTDGGHDSPTEFEVITAVAILYFKEKGCDFVVLEVGLGGSGDSTNVCKSPVMTVITSISMDHMDRLGNTIEEIAADKAGIIKEGRPVVTGVSDRRALKVIAAKAKEHNSPLFESKKLAVNITKETLGGSRFDIKIGQEWLRDVAISMAGRHQIENAATALYALDLMREQGEAVISPTALYTGLEAAVQPGRMEVFYEDDDRITIIDGAHNADGARALTEAIKDMCREKSVLMVTGMLADKDVDGILDYFTQIAHDFIATEPDNPRRLKADELATKLSQRGCRCIQAPEIKDAYKEAINRKDSYQVTVYAGSLYMIGKIRTMIREGK